MALVVEAVELPLPVPSPARVGSRGPIRFLMEKEGPVDQEPFTCRLKSSKEFSNVCREAVSVSCGQPLLSYKPKRSKSTKTSKTEVSKITSAAKVSPAVSTKKSGRSVSSRVFVNAARLSGCSEVHLDVEANREQSPNVLPRHKEGMDGSLRGDAYLTRKPSLREDTSQHSDYPVFRSTVSPTNFLLDDYHKALIPFLRNELDDSSKKLKKRSTNQTVVIGSHWRATSLGNCACPVGQCEQLAWQAYKRDSYLPLRESKNFRFFRLAD